jgi:hypothetical protein
MVAFVLELFRCIRTGEKRHMDTQTHVHPLVLEMNRHGKTLSDVDGPKWEKRWKHGKATIEPIRNEVGADYYVQDNMSEKRRGSWEFINFNLRLLKKLHHKYRELKRSRF